MKVTKGLHLSVVLALLLGAALVFTPAADAVTIHTLLIIDGAAWDSEEHETSKKAMRRFLKQIESGLGCVVEVSVLNTNNLRDPDDPSSPADPSKLASSDNVLKWVSALRPAADDVVFVYFSGHGRADKEEGVYRHFLRLQDKSLYRKEIAKAIEALNCRLKMLITDTDSIGPPILVRQTIDSTIKSTQHRSVSSNPRILGHLFLLHEGFLNLKSCSWGQGSLGSALRGGFFTVSLMEAIIDFDPRADVNGDSFVSWEEVFELTKQYLNALYQEESVNFSPDLKEMLQRIGQTTQIPQALNFPIRMLNRGFGR